MLRSEFVFHIVKFVLLIIVGVKSIVWRCVSRLEEKGGACTSATINEEILQQCVVRTINSAIGGKDSFLDVLQQNISTVLDEQDDLCTMGFNTRLDDLLKELLRLANSGSQYIAVTNEICRLREMKQSALTQNADHQTERLHISKMTEFLNDQTGVISQYDDKLVRQLVKHATIHEGRVVVQFKSGAELWVEI